LHMSRWYLCGRCYFDFLYICIALQSGHGRIQSLDAFGYDDDKSRLPW
jgi:hypothetical protein